jgi:glycosyltransferase involved in cell wall biosynthesis|tara:strand:- start:3944 stop:4864 length:921 start_codon:yes stop_codon:yes gene_type:complete
MNYSPLVSVLMPVYQSEKYLNFSIKSILNQTFKDFELLIVYDDSSDKSLSIIKKFQKKDKRISIIKGNGKKLIDALNLGVLKSKGKYIARMDSDDISLSKRFEKQIKHIEKNDLDICGSHCYLIDELNKIKNTNLFPTTHYMCFLSLAFRVPFAHPSVMIRKKFLTENNLMYGQSSFKTIEDLDLWIRMYYKGAKFGNVDEILLKYRNYPNSLSKILLKNILKETTKITNKFFKNERKNLQNILGIKKNGLLNLEEQVLIIKLVFKIFFKTFNFNLLKYLKNMKIKYFIFYFILQLKTYVKLIINN